MVTPPERGTDMLTDLTPNGRAGWKTHALRLCNRHCAGSHCACMSPLLQRKMPWLQGSHLGITDAPLCFSVSCPWQSQQRDFAVSMDEWSPFCSCWARMETVKRELFIMPLPHHCYFSTATLHSPIGPKHSLILYFSFFVSVSVFILYICIYNIFGISQIN